jgi:hypothetical protein
MPQFRDFREPGKRNDIIIQRALRDIDSEVFVSALEGMDDEERGIFYRNMSRRAHGFILADLEARRGTPSETVKAARAFLQSLVDKHSASYLEGADSARDPEPPAMDLHDNQALIASLVELSRFVHAKGFLPLEGWLERLPDPLLKKGFLMLIDGMDPLMIRAILESYKESYLRSLGTRLDLMITGIDSMAAKENAFVTEQRLRALVAEYRDFPS